ncbi:hypothetical protein [Novosphingobium sp. THN1]
MAALVGQVPHEGFDRIRRPLTPDRKIDLTKAFKPPLRRCKINA